MRVTVTGRRMDVSESLREYANQKASKLGRFYNRVHSVEVIFDLDGADHRCEIIARADHHMTFVAKEEHEEPHVSLDAAVKNLERQLTRHKEKFRNRKHLTGRIDREPMGGPCADDDSTGDQTEGEAS